MRRFQSILEIRKCLHKRPCLLTRCLFDRLSRMEISNEARECSFHSTHNEEREVYDIMPYAMREMARLVPEECTKINVGKDEFNPLNVLVEACTKRGVVSHPVRRLIPGKPYEAYQKQERDNDEDE